MDTAKSGAAGAKPNAVELASRLVSATCPACGHHVAAPFYSGRRQPLATLGWPRTASEAKSMPDLPLDFVRCTSCGHVFNSSFDYGQVPYSKMPNLMFNRGTLWSGFLRACCQEIVRRLPAKPTVVEIGYGDAGFLSALSAACPAGRFIGFDPHGAAAEDTRLELRQELFDPCVHLGELRPDLIVSRHVLEHLTDPLGFIQHIALAAACLGFRPLMYLEVPCIDRALETGRTEDFYYEHNSHFTTGSFCRMLEASGARLETLGHGYDRELVYAFVRLEARAELVQHGFDALAFNVAAADAGVGMREDLAQLYASGKRVAIWGGTGKSAAFLCAHGADADRFPLVVDSDAAKVGTHVPGTGQLIRFRDWLKQHPVEAVLIPAQWRAADIVREMREQSIAFETVLIPHRGRLIDFLNTSHPYDVSLSNLARALECRCPELSEV